MWNVYLIYWIIVFKVVCTLMVICHIWIYSFSLCSQYSIHCVKGLKMVNVKVVVNYALIKIRKVVIITYFRIVTH